jgi:C4-dicarboxylate-binding protein DctP
MVMASLYVYGPTSFASKSPIRTLADFKGKKVRVLATKMESALVRSFGATGVPMPYSEVLPGLQRGTIDGVRSSIIVMGGSKFFTVTKSITVVESGMIPSTVMVSGAWLKKLSAAQRKTVLSSLSGMSDWNTNTAAEYGKRAEKLWKDNGAEVIRLSATDQKTFMDKVKPLGDEFLGKNEKTKDMYALLKAAAARTKK